VTVQSRKTDEEKGYVYDRIQCSPESEREISVRLLGELNRVPPFNLDNF
jgi:hypothetical protein